MSQIQRSVGSRSCRTEMLPPITVRARVPTTPYPHLRQSPHPHQFAISCPIYLCVYSPIYITRTLPLLPDEDPERRRPPPIRDTLKETRRVTEPNRTHPVRDTSVPYPHHSPNQHIPVVASAKPPQQRLLM
jgi:hypothetical protein